MRFAQFFATTVLLLSCRTKCDEDANRTITSNFSKFFRAEENLGATLQPSLAQLEEELELENQLRGKRCALNYTECMEEDSGYTGTMKHLFGVLLKSSPPFDLSIADGISEDCRTASERYIEDLETFQMWALNMYDATAKLPSGLLSGNTNQLGDFDLCLSANRDDIYGKYCLAALQIETPSNPYLSAIHNRLYAHQSFKSKLGDPGHRVPRFSSIHWGLCVPAQCTGKDVEIGFRKAVDNLFSSTDLDYKMDVNPDMCTSPKPPDTFNYRFAIGCTVFAAIIALAVAATICDYLEISSNPLLMSFSLHRNVLSLISLERNPNDLEVVHGIRFLNAMALLLSHKSMALLFLPYVNRTEMSEIIGQPWTVLGRAASLYTDPFIMISGTLTAYSLLGRLQRGVRISVVDEYVARLFRILPNLIALIAFCTFVLPYLSNGPMWNMVVTHHADICQHNWWRNLLFIHNYFGFKDMCLTHTHHVGIDTQLFFASPFMILLLWRHPRRGAFTLAAVATISTVMRYYVTYTMRLSNYVHYGTSVEQLFKTADYMYILPVHRVTVYIMGIFLGYLLRFYKNAIIKPIQLQFGNVLAIVCLMISILGPSFMGNIDYVYQPVHAAWYAAFAPILWCFSFAWIIFTCHAGYTTHLGTLLSLPYFKIWTRISYAVYLTQFPVFFYNVGTTRHAGHYSFIPKNVNVLEVLWIFGLSVAMTLLFESPLQHVKNLLFGTAARPSSSKKTS